MKVNNENFDKVLNKLVASTRSPRGRFTAENSWRLLESRLLKRRTGSHSHRSHTYYRGNPSNS